MTTVGLTVAAVYNDGNTLIIEDYTTDPENGAVLETVGEQNVIISYTDNGVTKTTSFTITVNSRVL